MRGQNCHKIYQYNQNINFKNKNKKKRFTIIIYSSTLFPKVPQLQICLYFSLILLLLLTTQSHIYGVYVIFVHTLNVQCIFQS